MANGEHLLRFDLQSHSTYSDGELSPAAVVERAAAEGIELLALTDHDTIEGVSEALAAGAQHGVRVVPAVEISSIDADRERPCELHILGYGIQHAEPQVQRRLAEYVDDRRQRTLRMAQALRDEGFVLDEAAIEARVSQGRSIGRVHVAEAALRPQENQERIAREDIADLGDFIRAYLIEGKSAFRMRQSPTVAEAIETIHEAGGTAIWAHPFWDFTDADEVRATIDRFRALGIDGVECFYLTHTQEQTEMLYAYCSERDLLSTASTDFHGPDNSLFNGFAGYKTYGLQPKLGPIAG